MTEDTSSAPAEDSAPAVTGPESTATADGDVAASAEPGHAPGPGGDAQAEPSGEAATPAQVSAAYKILNREFRDQKHAEEVLGAELGRTRGLQKQVKERDSELQALRQLLTTRGGGGQVQEPATAAGSTPGPQTIAEEVAQEAELYNKIAQDPEMGIGHALYAIAQKFDARLDQFKEQIINEAITPMAQQQQGRDAMARAFTAHADLAKTFPEIADYGDNPPEGIAEAQQEILNTLLRISPEWLAREPKEAIWYAVSRYRDQHGIPVLAQPPGTSGSPSALASAAAEKAAQASTATPLDGSGVPPQSQKTGPETLTDRWKREAAQLPKEATTPSGRKLGFPESA